jgi:hypothetical protein
MKYEDILKIEFDCYDLNRMLTIKDYLKELLLRLWNECEGFSSKRPFGNSGWEWDLVAVVQDNYPEMNDSDALSAIEEAIKRL